MFDDKVRVTNTAQLRIERNARNWPARAPGTGRRLFPCRRLRRAIERAAWLHARAAAAIHALGEGGGCTLLTGVAGAGKTTILEPLVAAWQRTGGSTRPGAR